MEPIFGSSPWDGGGDGIVTVRDKSDPQWKAFPVGILMGRKEAEIVARWLNASLPELLKVYSRSNDVVY